MTIAFAVVILGAHAATTLVGDSVFWTLAYTRDGLLNGEAWRLVTGHFTHLDTWHLTLNLAGLVGLGTLLEREAGAAALLKVCTVAMLAIGAVLVLDPATTAYSGLSGVLNALFSAACLTLWQRTRFVFWPVLLAAGAAKIGWEWMTAPVFSSQLVWPPHHGAHLTGLLAGAVTVAAQGHLPRWRFCKALTAFGEGLRRRLPS